MTKLPAILALIFCAVVFSPAVVAQEESEWVIKTLDQVLPGAVEGKVDYDFATGTATYSHGVFVHYGDAVLTAESATVNTKTGDVEADGNVRIESGSQLWVGEHIYYNFKTRLMRSEQFRTGRSPVFASGLGLSGNSSNRVYVARQTFVTTDDYSDPAYQVRASRIHKIFKAEAQKHGIKLIFGRPSYNPMEVEARLNVITRRSTRNSSPSRTSTR